MLDESTTLLKWKIENNSPWVNFTHSLEKNAPSHIWVDFHQLKLASLHVYKIWYLKWKVGMENGIKCVQYLPNKPYKTISIH